MLRLRQPSGFHTLLTFYGETVGRPLTRDGGLLLRSEIAPLGCLPDMPSLAVRLAPFKSLKRRQDWGRRKYEFAKVNNHWGVSVPKFNRERRLKRPEVWHATRWICDTFNSTTMHVCVNIHRFISRLTRCYVIVCPSHEQRPSWAGEGGVHLSFNGCCGYQRVTGAPSSMHHGGELVIFLFRLLFSGRTRRFASGALFILTFIICSD